MRGHVSHKKNPRPLDFYLVLLGSFHEPYPPRGCVAVHKVRVCVCVFASVIVRLSTATDRGIRVFVKSWWNVWSTLLLFFCALRYLRGPPPTRTRGRASSLFLWPSLFVFFFFFFFLFFLPLSERCFHHVTPPTEPTNQPIKKRKRRHHHHSRSTRWLSFLSLSLSLFRSLSPSLSRCFLFRSRFFFIRARLPPPPPSRALPVFAFVLNYLPWNKGRTWPTKNETIHLYPLLIRFRSRQTTWPSRF